MRDFFVSYNGKDKAWAEWISWTLEEAGYSVVLQAWDIRPGDNLCLRCTKRRATARRRLRCFLKTISMQVYETGMGCGFC